MLNPDSDYELSKQQNQKDDEQDSTSSSSSSSHAQQAASSSNSLSPRHTNAALSDDGDNEVGDEISSKREYSTLPTSSSSVTAADMGSAPTKRLCTDHTGLPAAADADTAALRQIQSLLLFDPSLHQDDGPLNASVFTEIPRPSLSWLNNQGHDVDSFKTYKTSMSQLRQEYIFSEEKLAHMDESAQNKMLADFARILYSTEVHIVKYEAGFNTLSEYDIYKIVGLLRILLLWLDNIPMGKNHPLKAKTLLNLGCVFFNLGKIDEALTYWKQLCEMSIVDIDLDQRLSITIQICQLILLQYQQNNQNALAQLEQARELAHRHVPELYRVTFFGQISLLLASALLNANKFSDAEKEAGCARAIFNEAYLNEKHPWFVCSKRLLMTIDYIQFMAFNNTYTLASVESSEIEYDALITALIHPHSQLTELIIDNCDFTSAAPTSLIDTLKNPYCKIKKLTLRDSFIDAGLEALMDVLMTANLTSVTLLDMSFPDRAFEARALGIKRFGSQLSSLALVNAVFEEADVEVLAWALLNPESSLTKLDLSRNFCRDRGVKALAKIALVDEDCKLTELDLSDNEFGDEGARALAIALVNEYCQLTHLRLDKNQIGDVGIQALAKALVHPHCKLTDISLSGNPIGVEGFKALAEALKNPACKLTALHLEDIDMDDASLQALVDALQHPDCKITHLYLGGHTINDRACQVLATALQSENCKLTHLYLKANNQITDEGVTALAEAVQHGCQLTDLSFGCNNIGSQGITALAAALQSSHCKLEVLSVLLQPALATILVRAMEHNGSLLEGDFGLTQYVHGINEYLARNQRNKAQREESLFNKRLPWAFFDEATDVLGTGKFKLAEPKTPTTNNVIGQDILMDDSVVVSQAGSSGLW